MLVASFAQAQTREDGETSAPDAVQEQAASEVAEEQGETDAKEATDGETDDAKDGKEANVELDTTGTPPLPPAEQEQPATGKWQDDYDGRKEPTDTEHALIWLPRGLLYPVHLTLDYLVRRPFVWGLSKAEENKVFARVEDFLTFADGRAGLYPSAFYDNSRGFWGGINFYFNDLGIKGHSLRVTGGWGTSDWRLLTIKDTIQVIEEGRGELSFVVTSLNDPGYSFTGLGPDTSLADEVYFSEGKVEGEALFKVALAGLSRFSTSLTFRREYLGKGRDPSILDPLAARDIQGYTGFDQAFYLGILKLGLDLDTRDPIDQHLPGSGFRLSSWGGYYYGPGETHLSFFRYGTEPKVFLDLTGANHMLTFALHTEALSQVGGEAPPLNEMIMTGGDLMAGFSPGRTRGESAFVYRAGYSWPLLAFADALLFTDLGNVYRGFFEEFSHEKMMLDWGCGLKSTFSRELSIFVAVGFGTNQLDRWNDDGFHVDNTRFMAGASSAY